MAIPSWPDAARKAMAIFYAPWNDIDIFIEDTAKYAPTLYTSLINNALSGNAKVQKVFPLGGKDCVITACETDNSKGRCRIYLIDGDLDFVCGKAPIKLNRLYRHSVYAIENYLISEEAIVSLLHEENPTYSESAIRSMFDYGNWVNNELLALSELFVVFAMTWLISPELKTIKLGIGPFLKKISGKDELDTTKINTFCVTRKSELISASSTKHATKIENDMRKQISSKRATDVIAAREFLFILIRLRAVKAGLKFQCSIESTYARMAKTTSFKCHKPFINALTMAAQGKTIRVT